MLRCIINGLRRILGLCVHDYSDWVAAKAWSNEAGGLKLAQTRRCKKCGYYQMKSQRV